MVFKPRFTKPEKGNPYYTRKVNGGYSGAIKGSPADKDCDVLSNCVGYAYGRFNEIGGYGCMKYLVPTNAENFIQHCGGLEVGQTPRLGACMVWQKGETLSGADGAGHVAIVEQIISDTEVVTSESAWGGDAFWTQHRQKGDGNWGQPYKFLGFIYNPAVWSAESLAGEIVEKIGGSREKWQALRQAVESRLQPKIQVGSIVRLKAGAADYRGTPLADFVYRRNHTVKSLSGNRVVITFGGVTVAAVRLEDLQLAEVMS